MDVVNGLSLNRVIKDWREALQMLKEGNQRFSQGLHSTRSLLSHMMLKELAHAGQKPFAIVLTCSDSRVPAELVFDQGLGDLFVIRVAGNVVQPSQVASIEYAAQFLGTPLCIVMGHSGCGAVKAAIEAERSPRPEMSENIAELLRLIQPSVRAVLRETGNDRDLAERATRENVRRTVSEILERSKTLAGLVREGKFGIVESVFRLETAEVEFQATATSVNRPSTGSLPCK